MLMATHAKQSTTDIAMFLADDLVKAYPDAKFILTMRDPQAWLRSLQSTIVPFQRVQYRFPFNVLKWFDAYLCKSHRGRAWWCLWCLASRRRPMLTK